MTDESNWVRNGESGENGYVVRCDECGVVELEVLGVGKSWFGNAHAALYYAGYHDGKEHSDSDMQLSMPEEQPSENTRD